MCSYHAESLKIYWTVCTYYTETGGLLQTSTNNKKNSKIFTFVNSLVNKNSLV